jgi:hypothetical protein
MRDGIDRVANFYSEQGYRWKFKDGSYRVPTEDEVDELVTMAMDALVDEPENAQIEVGRLIVKKRGSFYDVFVHFVEFPR